MPWQETKTELTQEVYFKYFVLICGCGAVSSYISDDVILLEMKVHQDRKCNIVL